MKWMIPILFLSSTFGTTMDQEYGPYRLQQRTSWLNNAINALVNKMNDAVANAEEAEGDECQTLECYMKQNN